MATHTTTGKIKVGLALEPAAYELLQQLAAGPRGLGALIEDLVSAEAARRRGVSAESRHTGGSIRPVAQFDEDELAQGELFHATRRLEQQGQRFHIAHQIDRAILAARSPAEIAQAAAEGLRSVTDAVRVHVVVREPESDVVEILATAGPPNPLITPGGHMALARWPWVLAGTSQQVVLEEDVAARSPLPPEAAAALSQGIRSQVVVPLILAGEVIGYLALARRNPGRPSDDDLALVDQIADSLAVAVHSARLLAAEQAARQQLQALSRRVVLLQEQERRALSRDLHDTSGQSMAALKLGLASLSHAKDASDDTRKRVEWLLQVADTVSEELHGLAFALRPVALDRYGLVPALEQLLTDFRRDHAITVSFAAPVIADFRERLPGEVETALYRIVQESLTNITEHAGATSISITLERLDDGLALVVQDDGCGFDVEQTRHGARLGLVGMRERAEMLGGSLRIESAPGCGTTIRATVPLSQPEVVAAPEGADEPPLPPNASTHSQAQEPDPRLAEAAELARANALSDVLVEIATSAAACSDADEMLRLVLDRSATAIGRDMANVVLREPGGWFLRYCYPERETEHYSDEEAAGWCWVERTRQLLVVNDTSSPDLDDVVRMPAYPSKSYACLPLLAGGQLLGLLGFTSVVATTPFHPSEVDFLRRLARLASLSLENILLREAEARQRDELARRVAELEASLAEQRRAQAEADEARRTLEALMEYVPEGITIADGEDVKIQHVSRYGQELLGGPHHDQTAAEVNERWRIYEPDGVTELPTAELPLVRAIRRGEIVRDRELIQVNDRGEALFLMCDAGPIRDAQGHITGGVVTWRDIHAMKQAQERQAADARLLAAQSAEQAAILESIADGLVVYDADGRIVRMNAAADEMLGFSAESRNLSAKQRAPSARPLNPDGSPIAYEDLPVVRGLRGEVVRVQTVVMQAPARAGADLHVAVSAAPMIGPDGRVTGCVAILRNVEALYRGRIERERLLEEHRRQRVYLEAILDNTDAAMAVVEGDELRYTLLNRAYQAIQPGASLLGRTYPEVFPEAATAGGLAGMRRVLETGEPWVVAPSPGPTRDKPDAHWQGAVVRLPQAPGRPPALLISVIDVTDRVRAEERLRAAAEELEQRVAERTAELSQRTEQLELLHQVDRAILLARAPAEIAKAVIEKVQGATGALRAAVHLFDATTETSEAFAVAGPESEWTPLGWRGPESDMWGIDDLRAGRPFTVADIAALPDDDTFKPPRLQEGVRSVTLIPMLVSGRALGALVTHHGAPGGLAAEDLPWVTQVADSLAVAIQSAQLREELEASQAQLQALSRRIVERQELERAHVADRLYNEAAQVLAVLRMQAGVIARDAEPGSPATAWLQEMSANIDRALLELHDLASDLRPAVLDRLGLAAATRQYCREFAARHALQIECDVEALHGVRLPTEVETGVYRVLQEALANAWQHAGGNCVEVCLSRGEGKLVLAVQDKGQGFDVAAALKRGSLGLVGMRERADALGGKLEIESSAGVGTRIELEIPV